MNLSTFWGGAEAAPYEIEQSLRFNSGDSPYLDRSVSTNGNARTFTISLWFKKGNNNRRHAFYGAGNTASPSVGGLWFRLDSNENLIAEGGGGTTISVKSSDLFRDHSAWYHFVLAIDTTQSTSSNRVKMYVNGRQISSFSNAGYPSQNYQFVVNTNNATQQIGRAEDAGTFTYHVDGYLAEYNLIDGTQAAATDFGETNSDGVWVPKAYSGSYGTNGFYRKFDSSATNGIGHDQSGNGNNWTAKNLAATDVVLDTPTNNFATYNFLSKSYFATITLSEGNLKSVNSSNTPSGSSLGTIFVNSGKWYCEFRSNSAGDEDAIGIFTEDFNTSASGFYNSEFIALLGGG